MARPRRLDPEAVRQQIVVTARRMLGEDETGGLTARSLAQALAIPASAIYRIFPTMAEVIMAVNQATFAELDEIFDSLPQDRPPLERLMVLSARYMGFMQANPSLWRALFAGSRRKDEYPQWYLQAIDSLMARLAALLLENCPNLSPEAAQEAAGRLYVLAHGAISLEVDGRLRLVTQLSGQEIAINAIKSTLFELQS